MTADVFHCPSCGAPMMPKGNAAMLNCPYCHAAVVVPEELRKASATANWSTLVYDGFISNHNDWPVGSQTSEYFDPFSREIVDGYYRWEAKVARKTSISTAWLKGYPVSDFHLIANCKHVRGSRGASAWGLAFRIQDNQNYFHFHIIDDREFAVSVNQGGQWQTLLGWATTNTIKPNGANQLEVIAREKHFNFLVNGQVVGELDDDRFAEGLVGLALEGYDVGEETRFDFLDVTLRAP